MVSKYKKVKTPSITPIDTNQVATYVANMLYDHLMLEQKLINNNMEDINNDMEQSSKPAYIKTSLYLFKAINYGSSKIPSRKHRKAI